MNDKLIHIFQSTMPVENLEIIPISFVCDFFDLDYYKHGKIITSDTFYKEDVFILKDDKLYESDNEMIFMSKNGFIRWILQINSSLLSSKFQSLFLDYQKNVINYLFSNAYEQQRILLKLDNLKHKRDGLYNRLHTERSDFVEYVSVLAEIMRLGKENKTVQQNIIHSSQTRLFN